ARHHSWCAKSAISTGQAVSHHVHAAVAAWSAEARHVHARAAESTIAARAAEPLPVHHSGVIHSGHPHGEAPTVHRHHAVAISGPPQALAEAPAFASKTAGRRAVLCGQLVALLLPSEVLVHREEPVIVQVHRQELGDAPARFLPFVETDLAVPVAIHVGEREIAGQVARADELGPLALFFFRRLRIIGSATRTDARRAVRPRAGEAGGHIGLEFVQFDDAV